MAILGIPSPDNGTAFVQKIEKPEMPAEGQGSMSIQAILHSILHSGLGYLYMACPVLSMMTSMAIVFVKGLCQLTGEHPAALFTTYSITIILVRVFAATTWIHCRATRLRHLICAAILALVMLASSWPRNGPSYPWPAFTALPLDFLYPLLAAGVMTVPRHKRAWSIPT